MGNVTELVLPGLSIDDYVFGVAAVGAGRRTRASSSAYVNPPRPEQPVRTREEAPKARQK